jgi:predicted metal-binding protein
MTGKEGVMAKKIGIVYCERIQDTSCVGCAKCYNAVNSKTFEFEGIDDDVRVVFKTGCGDCPGLVLPRLDIQKLVLDSLDETFDALYFGTCVKKAKAVMNCPMNLEGICQKIEEKFHVPVTVGTHDM